MGGGAVVGGGAVGGGAAWKGMQLVGLDQRSRSYLLWTCCKCECTQLHSVDLHN